VPYRHPASGRLFQRPIPKPPYVCSTSVSIAATCPDTCRYKGNGCYEQAGLTGGRAAKRDVAAAGMAGIDVAQLEADTIDAQFPAGVPQDGARGGRDLRLHVAGDAPSEAGARLLAMAARRWLLRGGGAVWTYTARWGEIPRAAWGPIHVLASVQTVEEADEAVSLGYTPAYSIATFESKRKYPMRFSKARLHVLPCPAETAGRDCASCRLCLRELPPDVAIGFQVHGNQRAKHYHLPVLGERVEDTLDNLAELRERGRREVAKAWGSMGKTRTAVRDALEAMGIDPDEPEPDEDISGMG
jgi:hypothetical protein